MEKLKDLIHDFTDILLALVIAFAMFAVVSLYLGDWFQNDSTVVAANNLPQEESTPQPEISGSIDNGQGAEAPTGDLNGEEAPNHQEEENPQPPENNQTPAAETETVTPPPVTVVDIKKITIPNGTPGIGIAKILYENGLIADTNDFVKAAESLNLSLKLKSGTFEIPSDATPEEMVKIIAKQN